MSETEFARAERIGRELYITRKELEECKNLLKQAVLLVETDKSDYSLKNVWVYNKHEWLKKTEEVLK